MCAASFSYTTFPTFTPTFLAMSTIPLQFPTRKSTISKTTADDCMRGLKIGKYKNSSEDGMDCEDRIRIINRIKSIFDNKAPEFNLPFSTKTRVGLWIGTGSNTKQFKEIDIDTKTGAWIFTLPDGDKLVAKSAHGLLLELSRRNMISKTSQTDNWGKFYVTWQGVNIWWSAREWKYYVAGVFDTPVGKEDGRRRPLRVAA